MLLYDWCNAANKKIFYKDHSVRYRLRRRRRRRRSRPQQNPYYRNHIIREP